MAWHCCVLPSSLYCWRWEPLIARTLISAIHRYSLTVKAVPWLVLIPGLIMKSPKIMAWMSYVCLVYFIIWILAAFGENQSTLGSLGVLITFIQFSAATYYTRLKKSTH